MAANQRVLQYIALGRSYSDKSILQNYLPYQFSRGISLNVPNCLEKHYRYPTKIMNTEGF